MAEDKKKWMVNWEESKDPQAEVVLMVMDGFTPEHIRDSLKIFPAFTITIDGESVRVEWEVSDDIGPGDDPLLVHLRPNPAIGVKGGEIKRWPAQVVVEQADEVDVPDIRLAASG